MLCGHNSATMTGSNLYEHFAQRFAANPGKALLRAPGGAVLMTGAELARGVARYANALACTGVVPGCRVTVQVEKSLENILLYLAVLKAGGVYQPLNTGYTSAEVAYFVGDAGPALVVCDPARADATGIIAKKHGAQVLTLDASGRGSLPDLAARQSADHQTVARASHDLAGLCYTSGTTGRSKGAMLSHGNLFANAATLVDLWQISPGDVLLHALPVFHVHGLFVALNTAFLQGTGIIWLDRFDAGTVIKALPDATLMMGVPTFYTRLLADARFDRACCANMRLFISGSAPMLAATHDEFAARTGLRILERYGMTETGMICSNPCDGERIAGTVGFALPDQQVRVADDQGREVARGTTGTIEVKGPNVFTGYWNMPEKTAEEFRSDQYFITGDLARMDDEGRVTIIGRGKDLIISGGFNVYPKEVEELIDKMDGVGESAVIGVPHPDFGEGVVAVVTGDGELPAEADMISALRQSLAAFKCPKRIFHIAALPRNTMGKVQKAALRETYKATFSRT